MMGCQALPVNAFLRLVIRDLLPSVNFLLTFLFSLQQVAQTVEVLL